MTEAFERVVDLIENASSFVVAAHVSPDGDAVGASLAMGLLLDQLGKDVLVYNRDDIPYNFAFLPGTHLWRSDLNGGERPDVTVVLDCAEPQRVGDEFPAYGWGDEVIVIDHHKTWNPDFATVYLRDVDAAATGELVYELVCRLGKLSPEIAECTYCSLVTDTGSFRYSNTSQRTFTIAGELVAAGVDPWHITSHVYESQPLARLNLLSQVLETLTLSDDGRLAFLRVEASMLADTGATYEMIDGFINYARSIRGVEVATQLKQADADRWNVSFRSRGSVDVSRLASKFGGGGHHNAAGCEMRGSPEALEAMLADALIELMDED